MSISILNTIPTIVTLPGQGDRADFKFTIDTTKPGSPANTFILRLQSGAGNNFTIYWGDGNSQAVASSADVTHVYGVSGIYQIRIEGPFTGIKYQNGGDRNKVSSIDQWGTNQWVSMNMAFRGCENMIANYTDQPDTSLVTSMDSTFATCRAFDGIINFDTTNVIVAKSFLSRCNIFNSPITFTNTSLLEDISFFLRDCPVYNLIPSIDTSNVTNMSSMFLDCTAFDQDISGFNISSVTAATSMMLNSAFSITNYDLLLPAWVAYGTSSVTFSAGTAQYSAGLPEDARTELIVRFWVITDGGLV